MLVAAAAVAATTAAAAAFSIAALFLCIRSICRPICIFCLARYTQNGHWNCGALGNKGWMGKDENEFFVFKFKYQINRTFTTIQRSWNFKITLPHSLQVRTGKEEQRKKRLVFKCRYQKFHIGEIKFTTFDGCATTTLAYRHGHNPALDTCIRRHSIAHFRYSMRYLRYCSLHCDHVSTDFDDGKPKTKQNQFVLLSWIKCVSFTEWWLFMGCRSIKYGTKTCHIKCKTVRFFGSLFLWRVRFLQNVYLQAIAILSIFYRRVRLQLDLR